jgi:uracil-DNA glycosylase
MLEPRMGELQKLTPTTDALYVPDIDDSLDSEESKREFWTAFRALGDWYADLPPY